MNITFLIGNGFDINLGLRSQYRQFLDFYCSDQCQHTYAVENGKPEFKARDLITIRQFINLLQRDLEYWSDFEATLGKETVTPPLDLQDTFDLCLADFETEFNEYLKRELARFDLEGSLPAASVHFWNDLASHIDKLRPGFSQTLRTALAGKVRDSEWRYRFITFNYTDLLDRLIGNILNNSAVLPKTGTMNPRLGKVVHIHGRIDDGMIMGVNDDSQIKNPVLSSQPLFHSSIVKPVVNQESGSGADVEAKQLINSSDEICIFGMSIGDTDACWWRLIGKWLLADPHHQLILFHHSSDISPLLPQFFKRQQAVVRSRFLSQCFSSNEVAKETASAQVFLAPNTDMFSGVVLREKTPSSPAKP